MGFTDEIERYRQAGSAFAIAARGSTARQNQGSDGSWSATMIAHHMADADLHFAIRIREVLVHENPNLAVFDEELYAKTLAYDERPIEPALLVIKSVREETADLLLKFGEEAWSRIGTRADGTTFTLSQIVEKANDHAFEHMEQLKNAL